MVIVSRVPKPLDIVISVFFVVFFVVLSAFLLLFFPFYKKKYVQCNNCFFIFKINFPYMAVLGSLCPNCFRMTTFIDIENKDIW